MEYEKLDGLNLEQDKNILKNIDADGMFIIKRL